MKIGIRLLSLVLACPLLACGAEPSSEDDGGGGGELRPGCETTPSCTDHTIQALGLQPTVAPGSITNTKEDGGFVSRIDATAGGFTANPPHAYVYGRFTRSGLEKVEISDEEALESTEWDIAFRRFIIRINSGNSGPSCIEAAALEKGFFFEDVSSALAAEAEYKFDEFYTQGCEFIDDGTGLSTSPGTALSSYYQYGSCLMMTKRVYALRLARGENIKLEVLGYYGEKQALCDEEGVASSDRSGHIVIRWAFLE